MTNLIEYNAYRIFGLDTNSNQKNILKRYKELINRLKINDSPIYGSDFQLPPSFRDENSVNDALKRLQNPKNNLKEYFFWFSISDFIDEKAFNYLQKNDVSKAIKTWKDASKKTNSTAYFYKKNLAILYCLLLFKDTNSNYLDESVKYWKDITSSNKFWVAFAKKYETNYQQSNNKEFIFNFRNNVVKNISDIYTDLYHHHNDSKYVKTFQEDFEAHGDNTEKSLLTPIYHALYKEIEKLKKVNVGEEDLGESFERETCDNCGAKESIFKSKFWLCEDGDVICNKCKKSLGKSSKRKPRQLTKDDVINTIQHNLDKLRKTGFYDNPKSKTIRDHVAEEIRGISIQLHNDDNYIESIRLLKISESLSGTKSHKSKIQDDLKTVHSNFKEKQKMDEYQAIIDLIHADIENGKSNSAFQKLDRYMSDSKVDKELKEILVEIKEALEGRIAEHGMPIGSAPSMSTINGIGTTFYGDTQYFVFLFIPLFPIGRYSLSKYSDDSYSFYGKLKLHGWQRYWIYALIALVIFGMGYSSAADSNASDIQIYEPDYYPSEVQNKEADISSPSYNCSKYPLLNKDLDDSNDEYGLHKQKYTKIKNDYYSSYDIDLKVELLDQMGDEYNELIDVYNAIIEFYYNNIEHYDFCYVTLEDDLDNMILFIQNEEKVMDDEFKILKPQAEAVGYTYYDTY